MHVLSTRSALSQWRNTVDSVSFIPTMGALHDGHLSLVKQAQKYDDAVIVSIYVNPLQFNDKHDFTQYPQTHEQDIEQLRNLGVDAVFMPSVSEMRKDDQFLVSVPESLNNRLCGLSRPGHFDGVATIVLQLFGMVQPHRAFFGLKDYQQCRVIQALCEQFSLPIECIFAQTVRDRNGLALSSRNQHLSDIAKKQASALYGGLCDTADRIHSGNRDITELRASLQSFVSSSGLVIEYLDLYSDRTLLPLEHWESSVLLAGAVLCEGTRLIDNLLLTDVQ